VSTQLSTIKRTLVSEALKHSMNAILSLAFRDARRQAPIQICYATKRQINADSVVHFGSTDKRHLNYIIN
jgi:hypothetical protein